MLKMYKTLCKTFLCKYINKPSPTYMLIRTNHIEAKKNNQNETKVSNLKKYWFNRYVNYIKNYENILERRFPRTMHVYRVFSIGTKDFYQDLKRYILIVAKRQREGINNLTREELQLAFTMRRDLIRISPLLLVSAIPFTNYIIFPLAYYFPRYLLTSHYWTLQQRLEFMLLDQTKRLKHNRSLFRCMQAEVKNIKSHPLRLKWSDIIACLGSGTHPTTTDIIACSQLFSGPPYSLDSVKRKHIKELLAIHGISSWRPFRRRRLMERGMLIKQMDYAIKREGGVVEMSNEAMRWALSLRGVNPSNMSTESMRNWLERWLRVSESVDTNTMSLLLHSPILLAYNHSTNWTLIYK